MLNRPIRRKDRQLPSEEALSILKSGAYGVLSVADAKGWPYGVPVNYIVLDGNIYLHCAKKAAIMEIISLNDKVCFTVVTNHQLVPEHITALYESVIVFGHAAAVTEETERHLVLEGLIDILADVSPEIRTGYIEKKGDNTGLVRIIPAKITGKASRAYVPVTERM